MKNTSRDEFELLIRRTGLFSSSDQIDRVYEAWVLVEPMLKRIRGKCRNRSSALAQIFRADACGQCSTKDFDADTHNR